MIIILAEAIQYIMATLDYLRSKWVKPIIEQHRAEGRADGRAEMHKLIRQWVERRDAALQAGKDFDEPFPSPDDLR